MPDHGHPWWMGQSAWTVYIYVLRGACCLASLVAHALCASSTGQKKGRLLKGTGGPPSLVLHIFMYVMAAVCSSVSRDKCVEIQPYALAEKEQAGRAGKAGREETSPTLSYLSVDSSVSLHAAISFACIAF